MLWLTEKPASESVTICYCGLDPAHMSEESSDARSRVEELLTSNERKMYDFSFKKG